MTKTDFTDSARTACQLLPIRIDAAAMRARLCDTNIPCKPTRLRMPCSPHRPNRRRTLAYIIPQVRAKPPFDFFDGHHFSSGVRLDLVFADSIYSKISRLRMSKIQT